MRRDWLRSVGAAIALAMGAAQAAAHEPAIWRVADEDSVVWIFGSFHALPEGTDWRPDALDAALAQAERVVFETPIDPENRAQMGAQLALEGVLGEGESLTAMLTPEEAGALAAIAEEVGLPMAALDRLRPWYAATMLTIMSTQAAGYDVDGGVELTLEAAARKAGLPVGGLETPDEHVALLSGLSAEAELAFLRSLIVDFHRADALLAGMLEAWLAQDMDALEAAVVENFGGAHPEVLERLWAARNAAWVPRVEALLATDEDVLVVVGATHLAGERGLIEGLRRQGLSVEGP